MFAKKDNITRRIFLGDLSIFFRITLPFQLVAKIIAVLFLQYLFLNFVFVSDSYPTFKVEAITLI